MLFSRQYARARVLPAELFRSNLRAQNLTMFVELADGVDEATWQWHRSRNDYSRWIADAIKDLELADEVKAIERGTAGSSEARELLRAAIGRRYTLPA